MSTGPSYSKFAESVRELAGTDRSDPISKVEDSEIKLGRAARELLTQLTHDGQVANIAALEADFGRAARALIQGSKRGSEATSNKLAADFERASMLYFNAARIPELDR